MNQKTGERFTRYVISSKPVQASRNRFQ